MNEKEKHANIFKLVELCLFFLIVSCQVLLLSSFSTVHMGWASLLQKAISISSILLVIIYLLFLLIRRVISIRKICFLVVTCILASLFFRGSGSHNPLLSGFIFGIVLFGSNIKYRTIFKCYFWSFLLAHLTIILLSVLGYLPLSGFSSKVTMAQSSYQEIQYFLGYMHPNGFGTILTMLYITWVLGFPDVKRYIQISLGVFVCIINLAISANTAAIGSIILSITVIFQKNNLNGKFIKFVSYFLKGALITMPFLCIYIGKNYLSPLSVIVNKFIQSRPAIWNYYLKTFNIGMISKPIDINLSIINPGVVGNGVLDGTYLYILLNYGMLALCILVFSWYLFISYSPKSYNAVLFLAISFIVIFMAFPESHMAFYYENPLILSVGLAQLTKEELKYVLS